MINLISWWGQDSFWPHFFCLSIV